MIAALAILTELDKNAIRRSSLMWPSPSVRYRTENIARTDLFAKKPVDLILYNRVAFAGSSLEPGLVDDFNLSMTIANDAISLKADRGACNSSSAHTKQRRQQLMGNREAIGLESVAHHQKPPRAPCFHAVTRIARRGLGDLSKKKDREP
jgi:hypothetical protein